MANQDNLTIGGIGADPSGAYTQIESGWDPTYADGGVTWRPAASWSIAVADAGLIASTMAWDAAVTGDGTGAGSNDTVQITLTSGATCSTTTSDCTIDVTSSTGGANAGGAQVISGSDIVSVSAAGLVTVTAGKLGSAFVGTINFKENRDEAATFSYSPALCVKGKKHLTLYHPAQGDTELKAKFQWTDDDVLDIDSVEKATWSDVAALSATADTITLDASQNTDWAKLDKMAHVRIAVEITDDDTDGFADNTTYDHAADGCFVRCLDDDRTSESNTGITIGGIGADPS